MNRLKLHLRGLGYYGRSHAAVGLAAAVGTATLVGALLVGDSMRASLRDQALRRLGPVEYAITSPLFFREALAEDVGRMIAKLPLPLPTPSRTGESGLSGEPTPKSEKDSVDVAVPLIQVRGSIAHAVGQARSGRVNFFGVDFRFWNAMGRENKLADIGDDRGVVLNETLARELGANVGDDVLIRIGAAATVSAETLLGRRDETSVSARLAVARIIPDDGAGSFGLTPSVLPPRNVFVPLPMMQRILKRESKINAISLTHLPVLETRVADYDDQIFGVLMNATQLADYGLKLRVDETRNYASLESERFLLEPAVERAAREAVKMSGFESTSALTYLAESISVVKESEEIPPTLPSPSSGERGKSGGTRKAIPYSTITAVDEIGGHMSPLVLAGAEGKKERIGKVAAGEIFLNGWAAEELQAKVGDEIEVSYLVTAEFGRLETKSERFRLRGIVILDQGANDPGFTPTYPGVTDTKRISDWDPPFPMDLKKITPRDEEYWDRFRATPKAFISLEDGQRLWASHGERFGRITSLRLADIPFRERHPHRYPHRGDDYRPPTIAEILSWMRDRFAAELLKRLEPDRLGIRVEPVRRQALASSAGTTDFGGLFIGFSFFLIGAAVMLVALLFRLSV
ncbi:MAG: hypothetical protein AABZ47_11025, partial [Planctomycetota bacterium]